MEPYDPRYDTFCTAAYGCGFGGSVNPADVPNPWPSLPRVEYSAVTAAGFAPPALSFAQPGFPVAAYAQPGFPVSGYAQPGFPAYYMPPPPPPPPLLLPYVVEPVYQGFGPPSCTQGWCEGEYLGIGGGGCGNGGCKQE